MNTSVRMLYRTNDPETSKAAARSINVTKLETMVHNEIKKYKKGRIADQLLARFPSFPYSSITARFSGLERQRMIYYKGDTRTGKSGRQQRVMRATI